MNAASVLDQLIADPHINGQHVDVDNAFGGQCWDLVELFAERCGVPKEPWAIPLGPAISAKEAWTYYDRSPHMQKYFDKIPAGQQQKGDVVVYDGHGAYTEGHIAVCVSGNTVFEENADPDGSPAHVSSRSSTYLLGALRIKNGEEDMQPANEGDLENIFEAVYALPIVQGDKDYWLAKNLSFKDLFYAVKDSKRYGVEHFINDGDIVNLKAKGIDASAVKGKMWKDGMYNGATGISGTTKDSVVAYINKNLT